MTEVVLSWSGGKDSALALQALRDRGIDVRALLTTVTETYDRISMHGVRRELLRAQATAAGIDLVEVPIPPQCPNEVYEERMSAAISSPALGEVQTYAFGDLFLEDIRAYRVERLARVGKSCTFPIWGLDTSELARRFVKDGFGAFIVCVDPRQLDASFAGRAFDDALLDDLPSEVDPCGERGEFHTFVHRGPVFSEPIECRTGEVVVRDGFVFCDVTPGAPGRL